MGFLFHLFFCCLHGCISSLFLGWYAQAIPVYNVYLFRFFKNVLQSYAEEYEG